MATMHNHPTITDVSAYGKDIFVVSDLHLASGKQQDGCFSGTENFFYDATFARWLTHISEQRPKPAILLINGDFVDFLRVTEIPQTEADFLAWHQLLATLGVNKSAQELKESISEKETIYGLKTNDYKSVWKLRLVAEGHTELYIALRRWLSYGNQLWIMTGNHDLEWHWPLVQQCLRNQIYEAVALSTSASQQEEPIRFFDDCLLIDGQIYVEHGHRYDIYSQVRGKPVLAGGEELTIPFGSFLNRYLLNRIELDYPFLDNIRPTTNVLPLLIRERFSLALKLLLHHLPFVLRIIPKHYYAYVLRQFLPLLIAIGVPLGVGVWTIGYQILHHQVSWATVRQAAIWLAAAYVLGRVAGSLLMTEPDNLFPEALKIFKANKGIRLITFGHTHTPAQSRWHMNLFVNTGTWIPIIENSSAAIRFDRTFTFLHIPMTPAVNWDALLLERWNDDALRTEPMTLINKR
ncbi:metallophosphoesterase [Spirosoma aerolatum]|uniref:metallophosphoesterase n=1 Tax=Spirosoma aerolatum TaxID=1211326 RepID=UPI0009ADC87E|nr:metallophosphoesterase [Spirosoma aerolatum]